LGKFDIIYSKGTRFWGDEFEKWSSK